MCFQYAPGIMPLHLLALSFCRGFAVGRACRARLLTWLQSGLPMEQFAACASVMLVMDASHAAHDLLEDLADRMDDAGTGNMSNTEAPGGAQAAAAAPEPEDVQARGSPDTWLEQLAAHCQSYQLQAAQLHLLQCIATAAETKVASLLI